MNIRLFNKLYWLRRAGVQKLVKGYLVSGFEDMVVSLHVHPLSTNQIMALPEGERKMKRLEGHGEIELHVGDEAENRKGDLLYYQGDWYECLSCQLYDHTMLFALQLPVRPSFRRMPAAQPTWSLLSANLRLLRRSQRVANQGRQPPKAELEVGHESI